MNQCEDPHHSSDRLRRRATLGGYPLCYLSLLEGFWLLVSRFGFLTPNYYPLTPAYQVEKPTIFGTMIGISFQSVIFMSFRHKILI